MRPYPNSVYKDPNFLGLTILLGCVLNKAICLKINFSFRDSLNPICDCVNATKSTKHCLLHCSNLHYNAL